MQKINYTPIDIEKLKGTKETNINFYLLIAVTIIAAIFSVLLFIYIQQKNEKLNEVTNTDAVEPTPEAIVEVTQIPTPFPTILNPNYKPSTVSSELISPTPIKSSTSTPTITTKPATSESEMNGEPQ